METARTLTDRLARLIEADEPGIASAEAYADARSFVRMMAHDRRLDEVVRAWLTGCISPHYYSGLHWPPAELYGFGWSMRDILDELYFSSPTPFGRRRSLCSSASSCAGRRRRKPQRARTDTEGGSRV